MSMTTRTETAAGSLPQASLREWMAVVAGMIGAFMAVLDIQITNVSLLDIEGAVGASSSEGAGSRSHT